MKKHQFEEIIMSLSIIIAILCYQFEIMWLFGIFLFKSAFDTYCALKTAKQSAKDELNNKGHE